MCPKCEGMLGVCDECLTRATLRPPMVYVTTSAWEANFLTEKGLTFTWPGNLLSTGEDFGSNKFTLVST